MGDEDVLGRFIHCNECTALVWDLGGRGGCASGGEGEGVDK